MEEDNLAQSEDSIALLKEIKDEIKRNNQVIDSIYKLVEDNRQCKEILKTEIEKKFIEKFLTLLERMYDNRYDNSLDESFRLNDLYDDLATFCEDIGLEMFKPTPGDYYTQTLHTPLKRISTDIAEMEGKIEKVITAGFKVNDNVLRQAKVTVFKFQNKDGAI